MSIIESYRHELEHVFAEASAEMAGLPAGLGEIGQALLARSHPLRSGGGANVISYLLPYWLREPADHPIELCRELAIGNIYAMLHFFLLDDAMDGGTGRLEAGGMRGSLALGQLLDGLFQQRYNRHFPNDSLLWDYYRKYVEEWAAAVCTESAVPMDPRDPSRLAGKAAPVKLCAAGLLLFSGQPERIPAAEESVNLALAVLQLSDDWGDWREDLPDANRNAFLTIVREKLALSAEIPLDERTVKRGIYHAQCVDRLADIAEEYGERLGRMRFSPPGLVDFQKAIAQDIRKNAQGIEESTQRLASEGGLSYIWSMNSKK